MAVFLIEPDATEEKVSCNASTELIVTQPSGKKIHSIKICQRPRKMLKCSNFIELLSFCVRDNIFGACIDRTQSLQKKYVPKRRNHFVIPINVNNYEFFTYSLSYGNFVRSQFFSGMNVSSFTSIVCKSIINRTIKLNPERKNKALN